MELWLILDARTNRVLIRIWWLCRDQLPRQSLDRYIGLVAELQDHKLPVEDILRRIHHLAEQELQSETVDLSELFHAILIQLSPKERLTFVVQVGSAIYRQDTRVSSFAHALSYCVETLGDGLFEQAGADRRQVLE